MKIFPSLPEEPMLGDLYRRFPYTLPPLLEYHDRVLRDPSPLTVATRELIAAYVSGLNGCIFCHGAHVQTATAFGVDPDLFAKLLENPATAEIDKNLLPLLGYVKKLTLTPSRIVTEDAEAVFAAGWNEQALFDAIAVAGLYNLMNRMVDGAGIRFDPLTEAPQNVAAQTERIRAADAGIENPHRSSSRYSAYLERWGIDQKTADTPYKA
ncbi:MAG: peroxidase [Alphaproteobacteria bacterium]|nr:peroxidase [Alphaproteobacteria bacterium]